MYFSPKVPSLARNCHTRKVICNLRKVAPNHLKRTHFSLLIGGACLLAESRGIAHLQIIKMYFRRGVLVRGGGEGQIAPRE